MHKIIDGVRLGYDSAGSGETIVLLHGFLLDRTIWDTAFAALARRCRVVRLDLRGSGESDSADGPALVETLAGDLYGLLDALDVGRAVVVGHSLGGYVALAFFRMYEERVAGLGLVASRVSAESPARRAERDALAAAIEARGIAGALAADDPAPNGDAALRAGVRAVMLRQSVRGAVAQLIGMKERVGSEDLLEDIRVPVTIVAGERDAGIGMSELEWTAATLADCELVRLPDAGRLPMLESPAATIAALERLLERCELSRSAASQSVRANRV